jgi:YcxB-like protein
MSEPIKISFEWTADDLLMARGLHWRHICAPPYRRSLHLLSAVIAGVSIYSLFVAGPSPIPIAFLVVLLYAYVGHRYERSWFIRRAFNKRPDKNAHIEWLISSDKLCVESPRAKSELLWAAFAKVVQTRDGFLFYPIDQIFHFLPKRGFLSEADFERLTQLAKQQAHKFIQMQ